MWKAHEFTSSIGDTGDYLTTYALVDEDGRELYGNDFEWSMEELQELAKKLNSHETNKLP